MNKNSPLFAGSLYGIGAGALWGLVFLAPALVEDFTPLQLTAGRYLIYGLLSAFLLKSRWKEILATIGRKEWQAIFWLSLIGNPIYYLLLATSIQWAGVTAPSLIMGFLPVVVAFVGNRQHPSVSFFKLLPFLLLAVIGVGLIAFQSIHMAQGSDNAVQRILGIIWAFGALAAWAFYAIWNTQWLGRLPQVSSYEWSLLMGLITGALSFLLAIPAFFMMTDFHLSSDWLRFWGVAGGLAIAASIFGNGLWNRASRLLPLTLLGQMIVFETLFALLYGFLWEQRWPTLIEWIAMSLLIISVYGCLSCHQRTQPEVSSHR